MTAAGSPRDLHYTTKEVLRVVPVTPRQLQWWDEHSVLSPIQMGYLAALAETLEAARVRMGKAHAPFTWPERKPAQMEAGAADVAARTA